MDYVGGLNVITRQRERDDKGSTVGVLKLQVLKKEEGGHEPRNMGIFQRLERQKNGFSSPASRKKHSQDDTLI